MYLETLSPDLELTTDNVRKAMACARSSCVCQRLGSPDKIKTHCPAHDDGTPSLSVSLKNGKFLVHCYAGCDQAAVIKALKSRGLWPSRKSLGSPNSPPLTVETLAKEKGIPLDSLLSFGLYDLPRGGVAIPYRNMDGTEAVVKQRFSLTGKKKFRWPNGTRLMPYGLERLSEAQESTELLIVEGESDCWTLCDEGFPTLGIPGATAANVLESEHLEGIEKVYVFQEPDNGGAVFVRGVSERLSDLGFSGAVRVVKPPEGVKDPNEWHKMNPKGFGAAFRKALDEATLLSLELPPRLPPILITDRHLREIANEAWNALQAANEPPSIFQHGGSLVDLRIDPKGTPNIRTINGPALKGILDRTSDFIKATKRGLKPARPPNDIVDDLLNTKDIPLPVLDGIINAPIFSAEGELNTSVGYQPQTLRYFHPNGSFQLRTVPDNPSPDQIAEAREMLLIELMGDFAFVSVADRTNALAAVVLPFARKLVDGPTPLHLIEAPSPASGKSLLANVIGIVATGRSPAAMTEAKQEEEWRKRITAKLMTGPELVLIDNLQAHLDSPSFAAVLTTETWEDRVLGFSQITNLPVFCTWLATGNNPTMSLEITRRTVPARLDVGVEQPWRMTRKFRHPSLLKWVGANRPSLVWSVLTLVQAWIANGRPKGQETLGSYESYVEVLGGVFQVAGIEGFLGNLDRTYGEVDRESTDWLEFCQLWWDTFQSDSVRTEQLYEIVTKNRLLLEVWASGTEHGGRIRFGKAIGKMRDRIFGPFQISQATTDSNKKVSRYCLSEMRGMRGIAGNLNAQKLLSTSVAHQEFVSVPQIENQKQDLNEKYVERQIPRNTPQYPVISENDPWIPFMEVEDESGIS